MRLPECAECRCRANAPKPHEVGLPLPKRLVLKRSLGHVTRDKRQTGVQARDRYVEGQFTRIIATGDAPRLTGSENGRKRVTDLIQR